jgi:hypothetical protein
MIAHVLPQWILDELAIAVDTQIVSTVLVSIVSQPIAFGLFQILKGFMNLQKMVSFVIPNFTIQWFHDRLNFHSHCVPNFRFRIQFTLATIA